MVKNALRGLLLSILSAIPCYAGDIVIGSFSGLNSVDSPATLGPGEAQDLLNVNITPGGKSVYKRDGLALYKTLPISTAAVHGIFFFQDLSGNNIQLYGNGEALSASLNSGSVVQVATGTNNATWQCTDSAGFAYCFNSSRDTPVRTSGTKATTTYQLPVATGTMATSTPDRLVVAGVNNNLSTLYFSAANTFTNFETGLLDASPFTEVINSPGSRITHIRYACGRVLWWKDQSFGYSIGSTQYDLEGVIISPNIGTLDNSSDEYNGHVYFRGQDNHIYDYDCSNVTRLSRAITPTIAASGRRSSNLWTQTTQSDFSGGQNIPQVNLSTTIVSGDINVGSFTVTENSSASGWGSGTSSNFAIGTSSLSLLTNNSDTVADAGFETLCTTDWVDMSCTNIEPFDCTVNPRTGTYFGVLHCGACAAAGSFNAVDLSGNVLQTVSLTDYADCTWRQLTLTPTAGNVGRRVKFKFSQTGGSPDAITKASYIWGGPISFYYTSFHNLGVGTYWDFDDITLGSSTINTGYFTSQTFDTGFTSSTMQLQMAWTVNTSTPVIGLQTSNSSGGPFVTLMTSTGTNSVGNRYVRYSSTISANSEYNALSSITSATILARSTGTYYSAVNNANNLTSWGTLQETDYTNGNSTITYYVRASTGQFTVGSSTPAWTLQTKNSTPNYSTGTYMQLRADFRVTAATETPYSSEFAFNWNEGTAADKAYIKYFNDNVWVSVSSGTGGINNQIQRWDLLNETWLLDNIGSDGFLVDTNALYIGSASAGKIYKFGGVSTDEGASILAFWKSRDFMGGDPFVKNSFDSADFIVKEASETISAIYTVDTSSPTTVTLNLYDPVRTILKRSVNYATGKVGAFYNVKFQDNSGNPKFEILGHRVRYTPLPWKVE